MRKIDRERMCVCVRCLPVNLTKSVDLPSIYLFAVVFFVSLASNLVTSYTCVRLAHFPCRLNLTIFYSSFQLALPSLPAAFYSTLLKLRHVLLLSNEPANIVFTNQYMPFSYQLLIKGQHLFPAHYLRRSVVFYTPPFSKYSSSIFSVQQPYKTCLALFVSRLSLVTLLTPGFNSGYSSLHTIKTPLMKCQNCVHFGSVT